MKRIVLASIAALASAGVFAAPVTYNNIGKPWIVLFLLGGEAGRALLQELAAALTAAQSTWP